LAEEYLNIAKSSSIFVGLSTENKYVDEAGKLRKFDFEDPACLRGALPGLEENTWTAINELPRNEKIPHILSFYTSLIISEEAKALFEERSPNNIQYVPLKIFDERGDGVTEAWFVHVYNWRKPFNLEKSA